MKVYSSLPIQVADRIRQSVEDKTWVDHLPGERFLARHLRVSRKTVRKAISILNNDGLIATNHGLPHKILKSQEDSNPVEAVTDIGLLIAKPIDQLRPFTVLWIDALRSILVDHGLKLRTYPTTRLFLNHPEKAVGRLILENPKVFWILTYSSLALQKWFVEHNTPCIVVGTNHKGIDLPSVDVDNGAICRHAAGAMLRNGHRKLAMITSKSHRAGDLDSENGFIDGSKSFGYEDVSAQVVHHEGTCLSLKRSLRKLLRQKIRPTAIVVENSYFYLTVATFLNELGYLVPKDISLISRDNEPFMEYLSPEPFRYSCDPALYARQIFKTILRLSRGELLKNKEIRVDVATIQGASLANI